MSTTGGQPVGEALAAGDVSIVDAYAHVGPPRFGSAARAERYLAGVGIARMCLVLFPGAPDLDSIDEAHRVAGERVRVFGMPYGSNRAEVAEVVSAQIDAGVIGFRFDPREVAANPEALAMVGRAGRALYATNPSAHPEACRTLTRWLESYPEGLVCSPHFLRTSLPPRGSPDRAALDNLVCHPRFAAILSRHGGMDSTLPYPHEDFRGWVEYLIDRCGWERIMWGSEYPVFFWRNERIEECIDWLDRLLPGIFHGADGAVRRRRYLAENAERLIFSRPLPSRSPVRKPDWLAGRIDPSARIPLFPRGVSVPMNVYAPHLDAFLDRLAEEPRLTFEEYLIDVLAHSGPLH